MYGKLTKAKFNFNSNWIFSKLWFEIYIYIYIYIYNQVSNGLYIVMIYYTNDLQIWIDFSYMIRYFMVYLYWTLHFYTKLTHLALKLKKLRLYGTCGARLNCYNIYIYIYIGWNPIFTLN